MRKKAKTRARTIPFRKSSTDIPVCETMPEPGYTIGDHPSDLELNIRGRTPKELFAEAARAVIEFSGPLPAPCPAFRRPVTLAAFDRGELLVLWLNEIIYLLETGFLPVLPVEIDSLTARKLRTSLKGRPLDPGTPFAGPEIKAATYHRLSVRKSGRFWQARIILDL